MGVNGTEGELDKVEKTSDEHARGETVPGIPPEWFLALTSLDSILIQTKECRKGDEKVDGVEGTAKSIHGLSVLDGIIWIVFQGPSLHECQRIRQGRDDEDLCDEVVSGICAEEDVGECVIHGEVCLSDEKERNRNVVQS